MPHRSLDEMLRATSLILGHGVPQATKTTIEFFKILAVSGSTSQLFCRVHPNCRLFTAHSFPCCDFKPLRVINTWNMYFWCPCPARRAKSVGEEDLADVPVEQTEGNPRCRPRFGPPQPYSETSMSANVCYIISVFFVLMVRGSKGFQNPPLRMPNPKHLQHLFRK